MSKIHIPTHTHTHAHIHIHRSYALQVQQYAKRDSSHVVVVHVFQPLGLVNRWGFYATGVSTLHMCTIFMHQVLVTCSSLKRRPQCRRSAS